MNCTIPDCYNPIENREAGLCASHNRLSRRQSSKPPKRIRINPVSDKMKEQLAIYGRLKKVWIGTKDKCGVRGCYERPIDVHHMGGRTGNLLLDTTYWLPVCRSCHAKIEMYPAWAKREGYSLERLAV